jgi:prepilin-type N-terminal cleavage/methylation domain-containing protein
MRRRKGVSLIEIILAVVILGLVAALTIPRLSSAAVAPDGTALLREHLKVLRVAIERYYQDHGVFPGQSADGAHAGGTAATVIAQLTQYSDAAGIVTDTPDEAHPFGPYLREEFPACPVPPHVGARGVHVTAASAAPPLAPADVECGWSYNCETGQIAPNSAALDAAGRSYCNY